MPERVVALGELAHNVPGGGWVLVFGGVTREGNRRARAATEKSAELGLAVIWFDGYREYDGDGGGQRVPLGADPGEARVVVVDYSEAERGHWINLLGRTSLSPNHAKPVEQLVRSAGKRGGIVRRVRRAVTRAWWVFRTKVLRRLSQTFRGVVGWRLVRADVTAVADQAPPPSQIIYGDDFAQTQAWHAVRIWPDVEARIEMVPQ